MEIFLMFKGDSVEVRLWGGLEYLELPPLKPYKDYHH